jgi:hypothetical protein
LGAGAVAATTATITASMAPARPGPRRARPRFPVRRVAMSSFIGIQAISL